MEGKKLTVYDVTITYPEKKEFVRETIVASTNVRAFMKVLAGSKFKNLDPDAVLYHTEQITSFKSEE